MLRWTLAAMLAVVATPSQALVRLETSFASFDAASVGYEEFEPGLGTSGRGVGFSDIGGCEGADENGERCGAYESSGFALTLTNNSLNYAASLSQDHASAFTDLSTAFYVSAMFRADREMRLRTRETRSVIIPLCDGSCTNGIGSGIWQTQDGDGSWVVFVDMGTSAATREGIQQVSHNYSLSLAEVPEPDAWALMIAGFGLVGAAQRRQRAGTARTIT